MTCHPWSPASMSNKAGTHPSTSGTSEDEPASRYPASARISAQLRAITRSSEGWRVRRARIRRRARPRSRQCLTSAARSVLALQRPQDESLGPLVLTRELAESVPVALDMSLPASWKRAGSASSAPGTWHPRAGARCSRPGRAPEHVNLFVVYRHDDVDRGQQFARSVDQHTSDRTGRDLYGCCVPTCGGWWTVPQHARSGIIPHGSRHASLSAYRDRRRGRVSPVAARCGSNSSWPKMPPRYPWQAVDNGRMHDPSLAYLTNGTGRSEGRTKWRSRWT